MDYMTLTQDVYIGLYMCVFVPELPLVADRQNQWPSSGERALVRLPFFLLVRTFPSPQSLHYAAPVAPFHPLFLFAAHYCCFPGVGVGRVLVDVSTILLAVRIA